MAKRRTRFMVLFLVLAMALSLLPSSAIAADEISYPTDAAVTEDTVSATEESDTTTGEIKEQADDTSDQTQGTEVLPDTDTETAETKTTNTTAQKNAVTTTKAVKTSDSQDRGATTLSTSDNGVMASSYDPYASVLYTYATEVDSGLIRYVAQKPTSSYYRTSYWGSWAGEQTKWLCKSADVSMMLSYLGIEMLPKDIMSKCSDNTCMNRDWGEAKHDSSLSFEQAMNNYLNGGGSYSPPMIRLTNDCFKKSGQHFVLVISKKSANTYEVLDPYQNDIWEMSVSGNKITKFKWGSKTYSSTFTNIYQYSLDQETKLTEASKPTTMKAGTIFAPTGVLSGSQTISKVTAGCYDMTGQMQSCCYQTAEPDTVGYDLAAMSNKLKFNELTPGVYKYVVQATVAGETKTYLSTYFVVLASGKTVDNATFYLDNGGNIKYCAVPKGKSNSNCANMCVTRNTESAYMRFQAKYVGSGYYTLQNLGSGKYLTVYKSTNASGTRVIQYSMVKRDGQYWQILPTGNGNYYLVPKCAPGCCLTLSQATVTDGVGMQIKTANHNVCKSWLLRYVRPLLTSTSNTASGIQVKWGTISGATGYRIYRKANSDTSWTRVKIITSGKTESWTDTKVTNGARYTYTMRAIYNKAYSPICPTRTALRLTAPVIESLKNTAKQQLTITWYGSSKADGYQVCYATARSFQNNKTVTVNGSKTRSKNLVGLTKGKVYYLKVRSYKTVSGVKYYSAWSSQKALQITK